MNADRTWSATVPSTSGFTTPVEVVFDPPGSLDYRQRLAPSSR
jgi:hypothetical protein